MQRAVSSCRGALVLASLLAIVSATGCGSSGAANTSKVTGKITTADGAPVKGVTVSFQGVGGKAFGSSGTTGDDGSYSLSTFEEGDGAPPGDYTVSISTAEGTVLPLAGKPEVKVEAKSNTFDFKIEGAVPAPSPAAAATPE